MFFHGTFGLNFPIKRRRRHVIDNTYYSDDYFIKVILHSSLNSFSIRIGPYLRFKKHGK
jgi:hypothetical protein